MKAIGIGVLSALFFAVTFVLNRSMELDGGSWLWSAALRYFFMVPFLFVIVAMRGGLSGMKREMTAAPRPFFIWSFVAFVLFYGPLTFSAGYSPGWLVAGTWQMTIVAGVLLAPFFTFQAKTETGDLRTIRHRIPKASLIISLIILVGVVLIQIPHANSVSTKIILLGTLPLVMAAFAYPLGNRKMMDLLGGRLDMFQRVLAMTLMTLPIWLVMALYAWATVGLPSTSQVVQSVIVAVSSGVIATSLFFMATDMVQHDQGKLAAVEATQSVELIFAMLGEMVLLSLPLPGALSLVGVLVIIGGMSLHSYQTALAAK
ncbi:multidrug resistance efflux transporter family protein [Mammaliicoccus sciuri]|uniref:YjlA like protein n=1 Tax=Sporosarcina newyorkensis 2681 TaxID=1027292 RepID=F9DS82_9BACL|nr:MULTISPECIES: multidrug resistance efflux transporter family protein [Sporosarcina]EGQ26382.1 YjlA like protein [Sporosarcina newyorkensis 2681]MBY0223720.1 multidrug resistance efflux transporter family protein [Sporosarcina aquimarina]